MWPCNPQRRVSVWGHVGPLGLLLFLIWAISAHFSIEPQPNSEICKTLACFQETEQVSLVTHREQPKHVSKSNKQLVSSKETDNYCLLWVPSSKSIPPFLMRFLGLPRPNVSSFRGLRKIIERADLVVKQGPWTSGHGSCRKEAHPDKSGQSSVSLQLVVWSWIGGLVDFQGWGFPILQTAIPNHQLWVDCLWVILPCSPKCSVIGDTMK